MGYNKQLRSSGFTIVELLIVIVVIGILAAITIVAYGGIQARARDSLRKNDIDTITKALELYYIDNGKYPLSGGSTAINAGWSTTADASWPNLRTLLQPYANKLPTDPISTPGNASLWASGGYNYDYYSNQSTYCGASYGQMYILVYRLESSAQTNTLTGACTANPLGPYSPSNYRVVR